jgi:hypothetical protein
VTTAPAAVSTAAPAPAAVAAALAEEEDDTIHEAKLETISESLIHHSPASETIPLTPASPPTSRPTRRLSEGHIKKFVKNGASYSREQSCYHWSLVEAQREFGRRVAAKLLGSDSSNSKGQVTFPLLTYLSPPPPTPPWKTVGSPLHRIQSPVAETPPDAGPQVVPAEEYELNLPVDQLKSPILGVILIEFLGLPPHSSLPDRCR